ncbi:MAG: SEL1-like repeat protein [Salinarimonas sp.]|nr:SEL1-like repeat protein [Salinarimonas sp.]
MRHNVQSNTPWYLEGLDPDTRDAAREAARRSGMSLDEWLQATISDRATRAFSDRGYAERGYADRGYPERGYAERGYGERGYAEREPAEPAPTVRRRAAPSRSQQTQGYGSAYDELDAIAARINKATRQRGQAPSGPPRGEARAEGRGGQPGGIDAIVNAVAGETERRSRESNARTAEALDSVVRWIERTEDRMNESTRTLSESTRIALERQDHTANVLGEALAMMTKRLDDIEHKVVDGQQPSIAAALQAVEKVESHLARLSESQAQTKAEIEAARAAQAEQARRDQHFGNAAEQAAQEAERRAQEEASMLLGRQQETIENALRSFEDRIAAITEKLAQTNASNQVQNAKKGEMTPDTPVQERRRSGLAAELHNAVAEIRARQSSLDAEDQNTSRRNTEEMLGTLRGDVARLGAQLQAIKETGSRDGERIAQEMRNGVRKDVREEVRENLDALSKRLEGLARNDDLADLEESLSELTREAIRAADAGREKELARINGLIERVQTEIAGIAQATTDGVHAKIAEDYRKLSAQIETLGSSDRELAATLTRELESMRSLYGQLADPSRVDELNAQLRELSHRVGHMARGQIDAVEFATLRSAVDDIRGSVKASRASQADAEQMREQFGTLAGKLDSLSERIPQADLSRLGQQYEDLAGRISELAANDGRAELASLGEQVETMASRLEDLAGRMSAPQAEAMAREVAAMSADLQNLPQAGSAEITALASQFETLNAKIDELASRPATADLSPVARQIEALERKLEETLQTRNAAPEVPAEVLGRLDELAAKIDRIGNNERPDFEREFKQLQSNLEAALASSSARPPAGFEALMERMNQLDENLRAVDLRSEVRPLEEMLYQLAAKLDAAEQPNASLEAIDALEAQIAEIAKRLESERDAGAEPSPIDKAMDDLMRQIESMREGAVEAAERAAKAAIADTLEALPRGDSQNEIDFLSKSLSDLKDLQNAAEQRSMDTLGSVQGTLDKLVERLTMLESKARAPQGAAARRAVAGRGQGVETRAADAGTAQPALAADSPATPRAPMTPAQLLDQLKLQRGAPVAQETRPAHALKPSDAAQINASQVKAHFQAGSLTDEADRPFATVGSLGDDTLIEPGAGRPAAAARANGNPDEKTVRHDPEAESAEIKANFIAAARRAAQNAAAEAAAATRKETPRDARDKARGAAPADKSMTATRAKGAKPELDKAAGEKAAAGGRRRPLLMAAAAVVLAAGAFQIAPHLMQSEERGPIAEAYRDDADSVLAEIADADAALPQAAPALENADAGGVETGIDAQPTETASIDPESSVIEAFSPTALPSIVGMESLLNGGGQTRSADAPIPVLPPRRGDTGQAASGQASGQETGWVLAPESELHPNIVSADEIPSGRGPSDLREAMLAGDVAAVYAFATLAVDGKGMQRDPALAAKLFERAAAHGLVPAQYRIGNLYEKGIGVSRDYALASLWYQRAAENGNARAMHNLAVLMAEGVHGSPDFAGALDWFRQASELGIRDSQYNLAVLKARGMGTEQDLAGSYKWFAIAARQGDTDAAAKRDEVAARLDSRALAMAEAEVEVWRASEPDPAANTVAMPMQSPGAQSSRQAMVIDPAS